jgi:hypothetical protein
LLFTSSVSGASRSVAPASLEVWALLSATPPSGGSLVISLRMTLQSAAVFGAGFALGMSVAATMGSGATVLVVTTSPEGGG